MLSIEQVFVPVDFSRSSRAALAMASALVAPPPRLHLAHVLARWPVYMRDVLFPYAALGEDEVEFEHELIERARAAMLTHLELSGEGDGGEQPELTLRMGAPREELPELLTRVDADLVVMGAFGEGGPMPESLGSLAARMLRAATVPVLLTRHFTRAPTIKRVLCALDLTPHNADVLDAAMSVAVATGAELELLFVLPDPLRQDPNNLLRGHVRVKKERLLERERPKIEALFDRAQQQLDVPYPHRARVAELGRNRRVEFGSPANAIVRRADAIDADLIVIGTRNLEQPTSMNLGRVSWSVTRTSTTNVLVVPIAREAHLLDED